MATWGDVARIVGELALTSEPSPHDWRVGKKLLAWERPLRPSDREALRRQEADIRHTVLGYVTHHVASTFWGAALAAFLHWRPQAATKSGVVAAGAATSALACLVDFKLTPRRLTPGFEHRLSSGALAATYIAFALGLAAGCLAAPAPRHRSTDTEA